MYSEQFMHYLYSYNMPKKEDGDNYSDKDTKNDTKQHFIPLKNAYASIPVDFHNK